MYVKKITALLITAALILANLTACNDKNSKQEDESTRKPSSTESQNESRNAEDTPAKLLARYEKANNDHDLQALIDCFDPQFIDYVKGFLGLVGGAAGVGVDGAIENMETMLPYLSRSLQDEYKQKDDIPTMKLKEISVTETGENRATVTYEETFIFADSTEETVERAMNVIRINDVWYIEDFDFSHVTNNESEQPVLDIPVNAEEDFGFRNVGGGVEITKYSGTTTQVNIPDTIAGQPVVSVGDEAFTSHDITAVIIPDSVLTIGNRAFHGRKNLAYVEIGSSVTSIGESAFHDCWFGFESIIIPDSVTSIGDYAFKSCTQLKSITVGNSVTNIGKEAFKQCSWVESIIIPDSVITISDGAFDDCHRLKNAIIGNSVTDIGSNAFTKCSFTSVIIPESVVNIGDYAFNRTGLTSISIPDSVTNIGNNAFSSSALTSVVIGNGMTRIGESVFANCKELENVTIGNSVTGIDFEAFKGCSALTSIIIPDSVNEIGRRAFDGAGLTRITYRGATYGNLDDFLATFG